MSGTTVWITGDQCTPHNSALAGLDRTTTRVLMVEPLSQWAAQPYHKRKLVLIFAAMRGFADDLRADGWTVDYRAECDDLETPLADHIARARPARVRMMAQSDFGVTERLSAAVAKHDLRTDVTSHANFVSTSEDFSELFTRGQACVTMERFYRRMRVKTGLLMEGGEPVGGVWNFDTENRRPPTKGMRFPANRAHRCASTCATRSRSSSVVLQTIPARSATSISRRGARTRSPMRTTSSSIG